MVTAFLSGADLAVAGFAGLGLGIGLVLGTGVWRLIRRSPSPRLPGGDDELPRRGRHL